MKIFYDAEFTGLHQQTTLISIGLVSDDDQRFYAEFTDYDRTQCDDWIRQNVLAHTQWLNKPHLPLIPLAEVDGNTRYVCADRVFITEQLREWLSQFDEITIWADCYAWDWVLFCDLFGGALNVPENIFYMPGDLATLFMQRGLDADTDREAFAKLTEELPPKHTALKDALMTQACHRKLTGRIKT